MDTTRKQINLTLDSELFEALEKLSKRKNRTISSLSLELIERAIELEEDFYFSRIADERLAQDHKWVPHEDAWKFRRYPKSTQISP